MASKDPPEDTGLRCHKCGYNLTGLVKSRCPECGTSTDDAQRRYGEPKSPYVWPFAIAMLVVLAACDFFCVCFTHGILTSPNRSSGGGFGIMLGGKVDGFIFVVLQVPAGVGLVAGILGLLTNRLRKLFGLGLTVLVAIWFVALFGSLHDL